MNIKAIITLAHSRAKLRQHIAILLLFVLLFGFGTQALALEETTVNLEDLFAENEKESQETDTELYKLSFYLNKTEEEEVYHELFLESDTALGERFPTVPKREDWSFVGWSNKKTLLEPNAFLYKKDTAIIFGGENLKLYAIWTKAPTELNNTDLNKGQKSLLILSKGIRNHPQYPNFSFLKDEARIMLEILLKSTDLVLQQKDFSESAANELSKNLIKFFLVELRLMNADQVESVEFDTILTELQQLKDEEQRDLLVFIVQALEFLSTSDDCCEPYERYLQYVALVEQAEKNLQVLKPNTDIEEVSIIDVDTEKTEDENIYENTRFLLLTKLLEAYTMRTNKSEIKELFIEHASFVFLSSDSTENDWRGFYEILEDEIEQQKIDGIESGKELVGDEEQQIILILSKVIWNIVEQTQ